MRDGSRWQYLQVGLSGRNQGSKFPVILTANLLDGNHSGGLLVNDGTKARLPLYNDIRNSHLTTERRKENDEFNRVNIMCNNNESGLLGLNQSNNVVETVFRIDRFFCVLQE